MTKEQILEFNKKCVEFLDGYTFITAAEFNMLGEHSYTGEHKNTKWAIIEYLKYHRDWNSIMEIVEKIENYDRH